MFDPSDVELDQADATPRAQTRASSRRLWIGGGAVVVAAFAGWFLFLYLPRGPARTPAEADQTPAAAATSPLGGAGDRIDLPPLDETDAIVAKLVHALSSHPTVMAWLTTDGLIRNFVVVVENIAYGGRPAVHLGVIRPAARFRVIERDGEFLLDPRSYERYAPTAAAADSIDPDAAARLYSTLKPRIEEAYRELGRNESFDVALERAIVSLLQAPTLSGDVRLAPTGIVFGYESAAIERLTPAQKQLIRMGPRNMRLIQGTLHQIALALGIPPARLPQARTL